MQFGFEQCPYCGSTKGFVYIHGHYQCKVCHNNVIPCCGGEQEENLPDSDPDKEKDKNTPGNKDLD